MTTDKKIQWPALLLWASVAAMALWGVIGVSVFILKRVDAPPLKPQSQPTKTEQSDLTKALVLEKSAFINDRIGVVAKWEVTFYNPTQVTLGNIEYRTTYKSETGTVVKESTGVIRKKIAPGERQTFLVEDGLLPKDGDLGLFKVITCEVILLR